MNAELDKLFHKKSALTNPDKNLGNIRRVILTEGLSSDDAAAEAQRPLLWKILLRLPSNTLSPREYADIISKEPSQAIEKIRNDTFRTLATDVGFKQRVGEDRLVRLLDAVVWRGPFYYVQGK